MSTNGNGRPGQTGSEDLNGKLAYNKETFRSVWQKQQSSFGTNGVNEYSLEQLVIWMNARAPARQASHLPTALLLTGADEAHHDAVIEALSGQINHRVDRSNGYVGSDSDLNSIVIKLQARQCTNLQNSIRSIIKATIVKGQGSDAYPELLSKCKRQIPLNFDLELLVFWLKSRPTARIVVTLPNIETFGAQVLADLISTLHTWQSRIPFLLILGVTSTIELLQSRLSKSCLRAMETRAFTFTPHASLASDILRRVQKVSASGTSPLFGAGIVATLGETAQSQAFSAESMKRAVKFGFLSHYLLDQATFITIQTRHNLSKDEQRHISAIFRRTSSFHRYCERLLRSKDKSSGANVKKLLDNDKFLLDEVAKSIDAGRQSFDVALDTIAFMTDFHDLICSSASTRERSGLGKEIELYQVMHDLSDSKIYDELEEWVSKAEAESLLPVLQRLELDPRFEDVHAIVKQAIRLCEHSLSTIRNDNQNSNGATVNGSRHTSEQVWNTLADHIRKASYDASSSLLHEAYILSSRSVPLRQSIESRSRTVLERALLRPGDYLGCECCTGGGVHSQAGQEENQLHTGAGVMPPACILFGLLQEAPTIINVRDLFDAFRSRHDNIENGHIMLADNNDDDEDSKASMTQFYRTLAELKMIGLVKASTGTQIKKRASKISRSATQEVDFVAKTSWAGL